MSKNKNILIIGARTSGYGESIAKAALAKGARVFATSLNPEDAKERAYFNDIGTVLVPVPLKYHSDQRPRVFDELARIAAWVNDRNCGRLDAVVHTVAGGFPRHPSVMKSVADILKGKQTFSDMATSVKRNVYYVNAGSFKDTIEGLAPACNDETTFIALTYRGNLPYFIADTKRYLERLAALLSAKGKKTLIAALPEAWTQSSQFFTGIEIAVIQGYFEHLADARPVTPELELLYKDMQTKLSDLDGLDALKNRLEPFMRNEWSSIGTDTDLGRLSDIVHGLFSSMRNDGTFTTLRRSVEVISDFVRGACGEITMQRFIEDGDFESGQVRQVLYKDLRGGTQIGTAEVRKRAPSGKSVNRRWATYEKEEIVKTLSMYGKNFLFVDRVIMESCEIYDGFVSYGRFKVPTPEENPILKDHFVDMPLFGGHLQMEAVAQFSAFVILTLLKDKRLVPILTGTEFPELNTLAPPGEVLSFMGIIRIPEKRYLTLDGFIENRFSRSKGTIRGMVLSKRLVQKMLSAFNEGDSDD